MCGMGSPSRSPHLVRGTSAAMIATFASLLSHVVAGGDMPGILGITTPLVLSLMVCVLLAGRQLSLGRLSLSVIASQTLFHTLFVLGTPSSGSPLQAGASTGHQHGAIALPPVTPNEQIFSLVQGDASMWASHVVGAGVTIFFLYRGEGAVHSLRALAEQLLSWAQCRRVAPLLQPATQAPARLHSAETSGWSVLAQLHTSTLSRRGPPRAFNAAL